MHPLCLTAALLLAQANPPVIDLGPLKKTLQALGDGQGHYVVYDPQELYRSESFFGDGKTFYALPAYGGGRNGTESWTIDFWEPRWPPGLPGVPMIQMKDSGAEYSVSCGEKTTPFTRVAAKDLEKLLEGTFHPRRWTRIPERLLRDDTGTYFFVDRLRTTNSSDRRDFRVFMGPRGKMKLLPLKDIVDDSKGTIFATPTGNLRLIESDAKPMWVAGKKRAELTDVPIADNQRMIYMDLGPYQGQPLGTPCDELM